jgi:cobalt-zinc-cadmium efflux system outer membrane protein
MYLKQVFWLSFGLVGCTATTHYPISDPASRPPVRLEETKQSQVAIEYPTGVVTLQQALAAALMNNPELRAFSLEVRAEEAASLQAGLLPHPTLGADLQDVGVHDASEPQMNLTFSQLMESSGKRSKKREIASLTHDLAASDYEIKRADLIHHLSSTFIDLLSLQQRFTLTEQTVRQAEQVAAVVSERVKAGKVSPVEETKANVVLASARITLTRVEQEGDAARKKLAALWGSTTPLFTKAEGKLGPVFAIPPLSQLASRLSQTPEIARGSAEILRRHAMVEIEKSKAVPDLTLTGGIRRYATSDESGFGIGLSLPLPLFNRNLGEIEAARFRQAQAKEQQQAEVVRVQTALALAHQALSMAHGEITALEGQVLPGAESAFEAVNEGYRLGKFNLLELIDAQQTFFDSRAQHLRALTDYHHAVAHLERLVGGSLNGVESALAEQTTPSPSLTKEGNK